MSSGRKWVGCLTYLGANKFVNLKGIRTMKVSPCWIEMKFKNEQDKTIIMFNNSQETSFAIKQIQDAMQEYSSISDD